MSRSYLFIPGDVPRMLQTLDVFEADAIIIDFEDAVSLHQKDEARVLTHTFLSYYNFIKPEIYIRINSHLDYDLFKKDLETIKGLNIKGIVLPKTSIEALYQIEHLYDELSINFPIIGLIETPHAFFELESISRHSLIEGLLLGAEDLTRALSINRTLQGDEILFARSQVILAAKSFNKFAIDTPFTDVHDSKGLAIDTQKSAQLGFDGKASIHPNHVSVINEILSPSQALIDESKRIVHQSKTLNSMRFSLDGKMIDKPVIERANNILEKAKRYNKL
jgi:citrate lyase subunit beta / citryl-CoA lyase